MVSCEIAERCVELSRKLFLSGAVSVGIYGDKEYQK